MEVELRVLRDTGQTDSGVFDTLLQQNEPINLKAGINMTVLQQLKITLWKDYMLRKKKPGIFFISCLCAVAFFAIILGVRLSLPIQYVPSCNFRPRAMPSAGFMPFVQTFICNIDNACYEPESNNEFGTPLESSKMAELVAELEPLLKNETFVNVTKVLPNGVRLVTTIADIINQDDVKKLLVDGIPIAELITERTRLRNYFVHNKKILDSNTFSILYDSKINLPNIVQSLTSNETIRSVVCNPDQLKNYLIVSKPKDLVNVSSALCAVAPGNDEELRSILMSSISFIHFSDIFRMVGKLLSELGHGDILINIGNMVDSLTNLKKLQEFIPTNISSVQQLLPQLLQLVRGINTTYIDFSIVEDFLDVLDPAMSEIKHWAVIRNLASDAIELLQVIQDKLLSRKPLKEVDTAKIYSNIRTDIFIISLGGAFGSGDGGDGAPTMSRKDILNFSWRIANNTGSIINEIIANNTEPVSMVFKILDELKLLLPFMGIMQEKIVVFNNILTIVNDLLMISLDGKQVVFDVFASNPKAVKIIWALGPALVSNLLQSLQNPDQIQIILTHKDTLDEVFCSPEHISHMFNTIYPGEIENIKDQLCTDTWKNLINELITKLGITEIDDMAANVRQHQNPEEMKMTYFSDRNTDTLACLYKNGKAIYNYVQRSLGDLSSVSYHWESLNQNFTDPAWNLITENDEENILGTLRLRALQNVISSLNVSDSEMTHIVRYLDIFADDIIEKLQILFVKDPSVLDQKFLRYDPYLEDDIEEDPQNQLWKKYIVQEKKMVTLLKYLFEHKINQFSFVNYEHFKTSLKEMWTENINAETGLEICVQTVLKVFEAIDLKFEEAAPNAVWAKLKALVFSAETVLNYFNAIVTSAYKNKEVLLSQIISPKLPEIKKLATLIVTHLAEIIRDFGLTVSTNPPTEQSIQMFMSETPKWPCSKISIAELFRFSNPSAFAVMQVEQSLCANTVLNELLNYDLLNELFKAWHQKDHNKIHTDWRKVSKLFVNIVQRSKEIHSSPDRVKLFSDVTEFEQNMLEETWLNVSLEYTKSKSKVPFYRKAIQVIDSVINNAPSPKAQLADIPGNYDDCLEENKTHCNETFDDLPLNVIRFIPTCIVQMEHYFAKYFQEISKNDTNVIQVLGFTKQSGPYIFYEKFADFLLVVLHSFRSEKVQSLFESNSNVNCYRLFNHLTIPENNSVTMMDLYNLGNYSCMSFTNLKILEDNLIFSAGQVPYNLYNEDFDKYNETYESLMDSVINLRNLTQALNNQSEIIKKPLWTKEWVDKLSQTSTFIMNQMSFTPKNTIMNILKKYYGNTKILHYLTAGLDALSKLSNAVKLEIAEKPLGMNDLIILNDPTPVKNSIQVAKVFLCATEAYLIEQLVLRDECNGTRPVMHKFLLKDSELVCPFDLQGINKDLSDFYGNTTASLMEDFVIETSVQNLVRNTLEIINLQDRQKVLMDLGLWQRVLERIVPDFVHNEPTTTSFSKVLFNTYKDHKVPTTVMNKIEKNLKLYLTVLQSLQGKEVVFNKPSEPTQVLVDESIFEDEIVQLHENALYLMKHLKFLSYYNKNGTEHPGETSEEAEMNNAAEIFQVVTQQINYVLDLSEHLNSGQNCTWCRYPTVLINEGTEQISKFRKYVDLLCDFKNLNFRGLYNILMNDFKWKEVPKKLAVKKDYQFPDFTNSIRSFFATASIQITLAQSQGLFDQMKECLLGIKNTPPALTIRAFFHLSLDMMKFIGSAGDNINDIVRLESKLTPLLSYLEGQVQVLQPIHITLRDRDLYIKDLKTKRYTDSEITLILDTPVNVNRLLSFHRNQYKIENFDKIGNNTIPHIPDFREMLLDNLNWTLIETNVSKWRHDTVWGFEWLGGVFGSFDEIFEIGGDVIEVQKGLSLQKINFEQSINLLDVAEGILQLLQKFTLSKLINSLKVIIKDLKPLTENSPIEDDFESILVGVESVENFTINGFIKWRYNVSTLLNNWEPISEFFKSNYNLTESDIDQLKNAELNLEPIIFQENKLLNLTRYICNPDSFSKLLIFKTDNIKFNPIFCDLMKNNLDNFVKILTADLNFKEILSTFIEKTINNVMLKANINSDEAKEVLGSLQMIKGIVPDIKIKMQNVTGLLKDQPKAEAQSRTVEGDVNFLSDASELLCGKAIIQTNSKVLKTLGASFQSLNEVDMGDYNELPTQFCKDLYVNLLELEIGKILWNYIKPMIRGRILFTPNNNVTRMIINAANSTFQDIYDFEEMIHTLANGANSISTIINKNESLHTFQTSLKSPIMQNLLKTISPDSEINPEDVNFTELVNEFRGSQKMMMVVNTTYELMQCVRKDRFYGLETEEMLEELATKLTKRREFIAGLVFLNSNGDVLRTFDKNIQYKIRMDQDNIPTTLRMQDLYWSPGPQSDFLEDLRYFRGFIQLQDMVESGIIKLQTGKNNTGYEVVTQQMPYPCWKKDTFLWAIYASQGFQAVFFFAFVGLAGACIRYLIKERETRNTALMNVMGLRLGVHYISWFIATSIEMVVLVTIIFIMTIMGDVLPHVNLFIYYVFLLLFGFSIIMFCYMLSALCKAASAASILAVMLYNQTFMPYIISYACEAILSVWEKIGVNLFMSSSFSTGALYIVRYEVQATGINWDNFWSSPLKNDPLNFGIAFYLLIVDAILYGIVGYILQKYINGTGAVKSSIFKAATNRKHNNIHSNVGVLIENISHLYPNSDRKALENVNIQLHKGQITSLLGENGAGKTTLINILTGLAKPSKGQIVINDPTYASVKEKQQYLGVCPQFSILLDSLSAREHLMFYAQLKTGLPAAEVEFDVSNMIHSMGLGLLENEPVEKLSEGTKRRVSVGISFISNPTLVVLDEPSSGVDPVARRQIWDLIIKHKANRTVLLTTHHFDEAELLSDRIIILHKGKVHCSGTPLELKQTFGKGYQLDVSYGEDGPQTGTVELLLGQVKQVVENAVLAERNPKKVLIDLPFLSRDGSPNNFEKVASTLEHEKSHLAIDDFSFNCTTLENVFLDICYQADMVEKANHANVDMTSTMFRTTSLENIYNGDKNSIIPNGETKLAVESIPGKENRTSSWYDQVYPLMKKRAIHYFHDRKAIMCTFILPTLIIFIAMALTLLRPATVDEPAIQLTPDLYQPNTHFLSYDQARLNKPAENILKIFDQPEIFKYPPQQCECTMEDGQVCSKDFPVTYPNPNFTYFRQENDALHWIMETHSNFIEARFGGWSVKPSTSNTFNDTLTVWYNNKGYHAAPSYTNTLNNAILQSKCADCNITLFSHPLKLSPDQLGKDSIRQHIGDVGIALVILLAASLASTSGVVYLINEKTNEEKRLQILSGVSPLTYYCISYLWDFLMYSIAVVLAVGVFEIFQLPVYVGRENLQANICLLLMFAWCVIPCIHIGEKFFTDPSLGFVILYLINVLLGIIPQMSLLMMDILGEAEWVAELRQLLRNIFLILPQFAFADGLLIIGKNSIQAELLSRFDVDTYISPMSWELLGLNFLSLFSYGLLMSILNILIEYKFIVWSTPIDSGSSSTFSKTKNLLETVNLRKEFKCSDGKRVAVHSLSLQIPPGQCFGLLGVNGAGKSTTFKMLTTELTPTSGKILIEDEPIGSKPLTSGQLGYCPQTNAMDAKLTCKQSLELYAKLKGIKNVEEEVNKSLELFGLTSYINRRFEALSGGNKRKLCAAVSILGNAPVILMDEPTSGMDPAARELIANAIDELIKQNRSVILTSHSMEECEALCSQVVILIGGKIHCTGSPQSLKKRFGGGYLISIRLHHESQREQLNLLMRTHFPECKVESQQYCSNQFLIPADTIKTSEIFHKMGIISRDLGTSDYSIAKSTLDQVFINLVQSCQGESDGVLLEEGIGMSYLNKGMDVAQISHL